MSAKDASIIWHLGFHKTGTTTIQSWLIRNAALFKPEVELFIKQRPEWIAGPASDQVNSTERVRAKGKRLSRGGGRLNIALLHRLRFAREVRRIRDAAQRHPSGTALVSDENIAGRWLAKDGLTTFDEMEEVIRRAARYARPARSIFALYHRDMATWLPSQWRQEVLMRRCRRDYEDWLADLPFELSWEPHLDRMRRAAARHGAELHLFRFEKELEKGPLGPELLRLCGVGEDRIAQAVDVERQNEGSSAALTRFLLAANRSDLPEFALRRQERLINQNRRRVMGYDAPEDHPARRERFDPAALMALLENSGMGEDVLGPLRDLARQHGGGGE